MVNLKGSITASVIALSILSTGCASKYQLSNEVLAYQSSLNQKTAVSVVKKVSKSTKEQRGICMSMQDNRQPLSVITDYQITGDAITYDAKFTDIFKSTLKDMKADVAIKFPYVDPKANDKNLMLIRLAAMQTAEKEGRTLESYENEGFSVYVTVPRNYTLDLTNLESVRVFRGLTSDDHRACHTDAKGELFVWLTPAPAAESDDRLVPKMVRYNVSEKNIDKFIAALSYLSPKARLIEGAGI